MSAQYQQTFFDFNSFGISENKKQTKKRIRYKVPTYKKSDKINQNILSYQCNQKHIFRYKTLHKVYEEIAQIALKGQLKLALGDFRLFRDNLIIYFENQYGIYEMPYQAEIEGTQKLPVGKRLRIHIQLLRLLRQGYKVKKVVKIVKRQAKTIL